MIRYIKDTDHYSPVLELVKQTKTTLWIGTSDLKDLYIKQHTQSVPLLGVLAKNTTGSLHPFDSCKRIRTQLPE
ncbi:MAG: hypothetical protein LUG51_04465 [Tannerellaceae bacterium]|nr:hypothetical protein [Tannerellaceae bacterium]